MTTVVIVRFLALKMLMVTNKIQHVKLLKLWKRSTTTAAGNLKRKINLGTKNKKDSFKKVPIVDLRNALLDRLRLVIVTSFHWYVCIESKQMSLTLGNNQQRICPVVEELEWMMDMLATGDSKGVGCNWIALLQKWTLDSGINKWMS